MRYLFHYIALSLQRQIKIVLYRRIYFAYNLFYLLLDSPCNSDCTAERQRLKRTAYQKPYIVIPSINLSARIIINVLIIIKNKPKVITVKGSDRTTKIGLTNRLRTLIAIAKNKAEGKSLTSICGNTLLSPRISKLVTIKFNKSFIFFTKIDM
jgi:hypothetical protein